MKNQESPGFSRGEQVNIRTYLDTDLFGNVNDKHQKCCPCCAGYCPGDDLGFDKPELPRPLTAVVIGGVEYLTDSYLAIRRDRVTQTAELYPPGRPIVIRDSAKWAIPESKPGPSTHALDPELMRRLLDAGLDITRPSNPDVRNQNVYDGGEHIGWLMALHEEVDTDPFVPGLATADAIRALATELPVSVNDYPWRVATDLLRWEAARAASHDDAEQETTP